MSINKLAKKMIIPLFIGILLVLWLSFNFGYVKAKFRCRPTMWKNTLRVILQKPYIGSGYRTFQEKVIIGKAKDVIGRIEYSRAHNDYAHTAQELGIPIMICIVAFFISLFKKFLAIKNRDKLTLCLATSVIIVLINMTGQTLIRYASVASTFIVLLALLAIKIEEEGHAYNY